MTAEHREVLLWTAVVVLATLLVMTIISRDQLNNLFWQVSLLNQQCTADLRSLATELQKHDTLK